MIDIFGMKTLNYIFLTILFTLFFSCSKELQLQEETKVEVSLEVRGGFNEDLRTNQVQRLRVIASLDNYNALARMEADKFTFRLPTSKKQTLLFVANEKESLNTLTAASFNSFVLNTATYFGTSGTLDPQLYVGSRIVGVRYETPISIPFLYVPLFPAYAKLSYNIELRSQPQENLQLKKVRLINVPEQFSLGGAKTYYTGGYTSFDLGDSPSGICFLPEHDPANSNKQTMLELWVMDLNKLTAHPNGFKFYIAIKDPYTSVDDGKVVRGHHYKLNQPISLSS